MRKSSYFLGILAAGFLWSPVATAQSVGLARSAIDLHNGVSLHNWRFDRLRKVDDHDIRERCVGVDFHKAECRLMSVDDARPDDEALESYAKNTPQPVEENLPNLDPTDFIDAQTLALTTAAGESVGFSFNGSADTPEDYEKEGKLKGSMTVDRENGHIETLLLKNSETFKPAMGIKISTLNIDVEFIRVAEDVFARSVRMQIKGKAFGLKKLSQDQIISFDNFTPPD